MHLIITGATGQVGTGVLDAMLRMSTITKVSILSRRPVQMAEGHAKANVIIQKDFSKWDEETMAKLRDARGIVWALGVSQNDVSKQVYTEITKQWPLDFIKSLSPTAPFNFVYVSGEGATTTPGFMTPIFGRVKGETEVALLDVHKQHSNISTYSIRPAVVDETQHAEVQEWVPKPKGYKKVLAPVVYPLTRALWPSFHSPTKDLGRWMSEVAAGDGKPFEGPDVEGEGRTVSNKAFRRFAGLA